MAQRSECAAPGTTEEEEPRKRDRRRIYHYYQGDHWDSAIVLFTKYFPFQVYPVIIVLLAALIVLRFGLGSVQYILAFFLGICGLSFAIPLTFSPDFQKVNERQGLALIRWHQWVKVVLPDEPFPKMKAGYVFGIHPHGRVFVSVGILMHFYEKWLMKGFHGGDALLDGHIFLGVSSFIMNFPVVRNWLAPMGMISANREELNRKLQGGNHVGLLVGGVQEVCLGTFDDRDVIYLKKRKGFIKLAMAHGSGVVPTYCFGENRLFNHTSKVTLQRWRSVNKFFPGIGAPFPISGLYNIMLPYRGKLLIAVGEPLFARPGESLDSFHGRYVRAVQKLFDDNVAESGDPDLMLVIE